MFIDIYSTSRNQSYRNNFANEREVSCTKKFNKTLFIITKISGNYLNVQFRRGK